MYQIMTRLPPQEVRIGDIVGIDHCAFGGRILEVGEKPKECDGGVLLAGHGLPTKYCTVCSLHHTRYITLVINHRVRVLRKVNTMDFGQFVVAYDRYRRKNPQLRSGQCLLNFLGGGYTAHLYALRQSMDTSLLYYDDKYVEQALNLLGTDWENTKEGKS